MFYHQLQENPRIDDKIQTNRTAHNSTIHKYINMGRIITSLQKKKIISKIKICLESTSSFGITASCAI